MEVDRWGYHMLILLVGVVYWVYELWGGHRRVEYVQDLLGLDGIWIRHLYGGCCEGIIDDGKNIISDGLSWVGIEFLVGGGVG